MLSLEERVYGLSLLWKEAEYNFVFWSKMPDFDWDGAYRDFLPKVMAATEPYGYYSELMKFYALLHDGHTAVIPPDEIKPPYSILFTTTYIQGKHVVAELPADCGIEPYAELIAINGMPVDEYLCLNVFPYSYYWHEKLDSAFKYGLLGYVIGVSENISPVEIETDMGRFTVFNDPSRNLQEIQCVGGNELSYSEKLTTLFKSISD